MTIEQIKLVKDTTTLDLTHFTLDEQSMGRRLSVKNRAFQDGGVDVSDSKIKHKILPVKGALFGTTFAADRLALKNAMAWEDFKLYRSISGSYTQYYNVAKISELKEKWIKGQNYTAAYYDFKCLLLDPFLYTEASTNDEITVDASPKTDTISNHASGAPVFPVITITADTTISSLIIENESDVPDGASDGLQFVYLDPNFVDTDVLIIDCQNGTVKREGVNTIRYFSGSFLKLLAGDNTIKVTCQTDGGTTIDFDFNVRYY